MIRNIRPVPFESPQLWRNDITLLFCLLRKYTSSLVNTFRMNKLTKMDLLLSNRSVDPNIFTGSLIPIFLSGPWILIFLPVRGSIYFWPVLESLLDRTRKNRPTPKWIHGSLYYLTRRWIPIFWPVRGSQCFDRSGDPYISDRSVDPYISIQSVNPLFFDPKILIGPWIPMFLTDPWISIFWPVHGY